MKKGDIDTQLLKQPDMLRKNINRLFCLSAICRRYGGVVSEGRRGTVVDKGVLLCTFVLGEQNGIEMEEMRMSRADVSLLE
jgi:hypothetical protein